MTKIYHNPRCSKSREVLQLLEERNEPAEVILYLDEPLDKKELVALLKLLKIKSHDLVRTNEAIWKEKFKGRVLSHTQVLNALVKYPNLMQRPIVIKEGKAVIGRPVNRVLTIL